VNELVFVGGPGVRDFDEQEVYFVQNNNIMILLLEISAEMTV
jgi:hypothetical protein